MTHGVFRTPIPVNEPVHDFAPGSAERAALKASISALSKEEIEVPLIIGGEEVRTGVTEKMVMPHNHGHSLGVYH